MGLGVVGGAGCGCQWGWPWGCGCQWGWPWGCGCQWGWLWGAGALWVSVGLAVGLWVSVGLAVGLGVPGAVQAAGLGSSPQRYAEAASAFEELLRRDGANAEAVAQLLACRALLPNGPHGWSSPGGVPVSPPLLEAGEPSPLPPSGERASRSCQDKDTSGLGSYRSQGRAVTPQPLPPQPLPATHPARDCYPLWVGNVTARIGEKVLQGSFCRFGEIRSLRLLPERRCAFINYTHKEAAEAAYAAMQDAELEGSRLVLQLKHPSHATPAPRRHPEPCGKVGAPPGGLL
ncbi:uncharacterized protein LOC135579301 isoform X2 [Columba livia]|uniref:uncharacterized protein LOC135579301 isoform X2 n=1 Tax=Columba livia TaxID=8932 RepID=UPI0031BA2BC0